VYKHTKIFNLNITPKLSNLQNIFRIHKQDIDQVFKFKFEQVHNEILTDTIFLDPISIDGYEYLFHLDKQLLSDTTVFLVNTPFNEYLIQKNFCILFGYRKIKLKTLVVIYKIKHEEEIQKFKIIKRINWLVFRLYKFLYQKKFLTSPKPISPILFITSDLLSTLILTPLISPTSLFIILLFFEEIPCIEIDFSNFSNQLTLLIKKILSKFYLSNTGVINNCSLFHGYINLISYYFEKSVLQNENNILSRIYQDYALNRNKSTYLLPWLIRDIVTSQSNLLSDFYLGIFRQIITKNGPPTFSIDSIINGIFETFWNNSTYQNKKRMVLKMKNDAINYFKNDYSILKIKITRVPKEHIFYLKIEINQTNGNWFNGRIEYRVNERLNYQNGNFNCKQSNVFYYNCKGRNFKEQQRSKKRKTTQPKGIFNFIEFNYSGKIPCYILLDEDPYTSYNKINNKKCSCFGKLTSFDCLLRKKHIPVIHQLYEIISTTFTFNDLKFFKDLELVYEMNTKIIDQTQEMNRSNLIVLKLLEYLFNSNSYQKQINYLFSKSLKFYVVPKFINFAIGMYKKFFKDGNKLIKNCDSLYTFKKGLLLRISLCYFETNNDIGIRTSEKIIIFFEEIIKDFEFKNIILCDFFLCILKCLSNLRSNKINLTIINDFILNGVNKYIKTTRGYFKAEFLNLINELWLQKKIIFNKNILNVL